MGEENGVPGRTCQKITNPFFEIDFACRVKYPPEIEVIIHKKLFRKDLSSLLSPSSPIKRRSGSGKVRP